MAVGYFKYGFWSGLPAGPACSFLTLEKKDALIQKGVLTLIHYR